jgi:ABC-2 type transport system ATP-binding protein
MQQRLNMAQALLGSPHTLILDEPMSGMDPPGRRLFRELMIQLRKEKCTLFFSTHVLDDVEMLCDDVVVLQDGRLTYAGEVDALLDEGFLGTEIITGTLGLECQEALKGAGCRVKSQNGSDEWVVEIPRTGDTNTVQRLLYDHSIIPRAIGRRSMTLEEMLYRREKGNTL